MVFSIKGILIIFIIITLSLLIKVLEKTCLLFLFFSDKISGILYFL